MTPSVPPQTHRIDALNIAIHADRQQLGFAAARAVAAWLQDRIRANGRARVVFACAPSQDEFLAALVRPEACGIAIPWQKVTVFHMDEYVGLPGDHLQCFRSYLRGHLLSHIQPAAFHPIAAEQPDSAFVCTRYAERLAEAPIDLVCLGIGENGHIAFNDPPVANFHDPVPVKTVELDLACRQQQVNDNCFPTLDAVPRQAITLTIPVFRNARKLMVQVPGPRKAQAVRDALLGPIATACPASILRLHPDATLHLDAHSAANFLADQAAAGTRHEHS
ncbi:MAG TPA: glucosamine-6-phosphate deaminase [Lacunisphaera sp.]|nr:glucosamine-6-phosphate deaminase [Lacunisphaera sp.]